MASIFSKLFAHHTQSGRRPRTPMWKSEKNFDDHRKFKPGQYQFVHIKSRKKYNVFVRTEKEFDETIERLNGARK